MSVVTVKEVLGRWALSELRSPRTRFHYLHPDKSEFVQRTADLCYDALSVEDQQLLGEMFQDARGVLSMYWSEVSHFTREVWTFSQVTQLYAMYQTDPRGQGVLRPLVAFAVTRPSTDIPNPERDPRIAADKTEWDNLSEQEVKPITVGLLNDRRVLIDGYLRALLFLRSGNFNSTITVFAPVPK